MKYKEIVEKYLALDKKLRSDNKISADIKKIIERGYVCCDNDGVSEHPTLLLTGINPSFSEEAGSSPGRIHEPPFTFANATGRFWSKKHHQFGEELKKSMAYFDLFPILETHQRGGFEKVFLEANDVRASFLEITQESIEDMSPKLIIHANRDSMFYWGIKKCGGGNDENNPWMGYKVERLTRQNTPDLPQCMTSERLSRFPLYKIIGLIDSPNRINGKKITKTNLSYLMEYVMEYRRTEDKEMYLYKPHEWQEISDWLNK